MNRSDIKETLWEQFFQGQKLACAKLISMVENKPQSVPYIRDRLFPHLRKAVRVGITGPPGVGKSTITAALASQALEKGFSVGIIAVDPSSPFTGGAFLGDRIRMQNLIGNSDVFIRSLASRSGGGLAPATPYVADVFDAFGMDLILIETVGVGQAELDVLTCADIIILILQPSTGDIIQMLKAGIMEMADLFVINKSDLPGADQLVEQIQFVFSTSSSYSSENIPPVLKASAKDNTGIGEVFDSLKTRIDIMEKSGVIKEKIRERLMLDVINSVKIHLWELYLADITKLEDIQTVVNGLADKGKSPYSFIKQLCDSVTIQKNRSAKKHY